MLAAIKHGLTNLPNFQGRDARQAFWYYVLFVYIVTMALSMVVSTPMMMQAMMTGVQQGIAHAGDPDRAAADAAAQAAIMQSISGYIPALVWVGLASALILFFGLAASLVRRLHDSGLSGWWAALPGALQAVNAALIPGQIERMDEMMLGSMTGDPSIGLAMMQGSFGVGAVAGWTAIVAVIVFGTRKSTAGPNRYGAEPFMT